MQEKNPMVPVELSDEALENVAGGLVVLIMPPEKTSRVTCKRCAKGGMVTKEEYESLMANGGYYCAECKLEIL